MKRNVICILVVVLAMVFSGCSKNNPAAPSTTHELGKLVLALNAANNIASGSVTIVKGGLTQVLPIEIIQHSGSVTFGDVQTGTWTILVQLYDQTGVEIYTGSGVAAIAKNTTTTAVIHVNQNTGHLQINVETPGAVYTLLFAANGNETFIINSDGTNRQLLYSAPYTQCLGTYRHGSSYIYRYQQRHGSIWVSEASGATHTLISGESVGTARWSWDGTYIAYNAATLIICNADGSNAHPLGEGLTGTPCCWTPDNRLIYSDGGVNYVINADGGNRQIIPVSGSITDCGPDYTLLMNLRVNNREQVFTVKLDGSNPVQLTNDPVLWCFNGHFSADGESIAYNLVSFANSDWWTNSDIQVWTMDRDGGNKRYVVHGMTVQVKY